MSKEVDLKKKVQKDYPDFTDSNDGLNIKELEGNLLIYAKYREETEMAKSKDEKLQEAKDTASELGAPYRDALKALKAKMAYINVLIVEKKGEELEDGEEETAEEG